VQIRHHFIGRRDADLDGQHQRDEDEPEAELAAGEPEVNDREGRDERDQDLADRDAHGHHERDEEHAAHGGARSGATALSEDLHVVFDEVGAGKKAHGRLFHFDGGLCRRDERHVDGEDHHDHAQNQNQVREEIEPGTIFNHLSSPVSS
jgi:hypothetical protein